MDDIDELLDNMLLTIKNKLVDQQANIDQLKETVHGLKTKLVAQQINTDQLKETLHNFKEDFVSFKNKISKEINDKADDKANNEIKETNDKTSNETSANPSLVDLPSYKYTQSFKEIKRPVDLNELYMMVLQSQHLLYELQTHTDNILRRN
jgi:seryl-tRNA synthetase